MIGAVHWQYVITFFFKCMLFFISIVFSFNFFYFYITVTIIRQLILYDVFYFYVRIYQNKISSKKIFIFILHEHIQFLHFYTSYIYIILLNLFI